jgi:hypothetical protein
MSKNRTSLIALVAVITTLSIMGLITVNAATVEESTMCNGYSVTTLSPQGETSAFLSTNPEAGVWIKISNPPDDVTFKFFYDDDGTETEYTGGYSKVDVIPRAGTNWGIAFTTMDIYGKTPEFNPGVWTCKAYIDGEVVRIIEFNVIDYDELVGQISSITTTVEGIIEEKNQVVADYNALVLDYEAIVEDYEELEGSTVSETQMFQIQSEYNDLLEDYDDLVDSQASTRTMMYAAIVVALIAVIVAVYFGLMKK